MTHRTTVNLVRWTTVACLALLLAGCSMADHHQTASDEARGRVARARAAMKLQIAQQQFDTGDLEQAEGALAEALVVEPEFAPLHTLAGRISLERGQLEKAEDYFNKAAELAPEQAEPHYYLGVVRQRWQRFDEALSSYSRAYELQNDNPAFLLARCEMLAARGQEKHAQAELERRLNYFESSAGVWQAAGHLRQLNGEHARAVSAYRQAALLDPTDLGLIEELARAQLAADMPADAVDQIAMLIADAEYGKRRDIQLLYVRAAERAGRFDQAREQCMAMTERNPRDVEAWIRLGGINWTLGDTSGALTAANRVMAISPRTRRPSIRLASATSIVIPADGPSLRMAPAGTWM